MQRIRPNKFLTIFFPFIIFSLSLQTVLKLFFSNFRLLTDNRGQQNQHDQEIGEIQHKFFIKRPKIGPCGWMFRILLHICLFGPILR